MSNDSTNEPETEEIDNGDVSSGVDPDVESDPALDDSQGTEWASEGGAPDEGPATATADG